MSLDPKSLQPEKKVLAPEIAAGTVYTVAEYQKLIEQLNATVQALTEENEGLHEALEFERGEKTKLKESMKKNELLLESYRVENENFKKLTLDLGAGMKKLGEGMKMADETNAAMLDSMKSVLNGVEQKKEMDDPKKESAQL